MSKFSLAAILFFIRCYHLIFNIFSIFVDKYISNRVWIHIILSIQTNLILDMDYATKSFYVKMRLSFRQNINVWMILLQ